MIFGIANRGTAARRFSIIGLGREEMLRMIHGRAIRCQGNRIPELVIIAADDEIDFRATLLRAGVIAPSTPMEVVL